jgi:oligopeptide transport system substrate-binding protein
MRRALAFSIALAFVAAGGCTGDEPQSGALRVAIPFEPASLDPGLASDYVSGILALNLMEPLVRLNEKLEPEAATAESWELRDGRKTVTFHLRENGRWTNGDAVTAADFEYAWKRILDPKLAAGYAYQLYGIVGAAAYNGCERNCAKLRDQVGVKALDKRTFEVKLTNPQPWFISQVAHVSFLPVHRATVETFGRSWTEPGNIVTNGPYRLTDWKHDESITLTKWQHWRGADGVHVERIAGRIIRNAATALAAFEAGELDACLAKACIPTDEIERLQERDAYLRSPSLLTRYLGLNLTTIPDLNQRRALAFALDRTSIVENVTKAGDEPATSFSPKGIPGFAAIMQDFLPTHADLDAAQTYLDRASNPKRTLDLYYLSSSDPGAQEIAVAVQAMWKEIGIETRLKGLESGAFFHRLGPPLDASVDVFVLGWQSDYVDDFNFLEGLTCESGNNSTGYCDPDYDRLVEQARSTPNDADRHRIYGRAEAMLTGPNGALPLIPTYWATSPTMRRPGVSGWRPNLLGVYDFTKVRVAEG